MDPRTILFGGHRVAMLPTGGAPIYYAEDMLGSSRVIVTNSGAVCYDADFYPFGGERAVVNTCAQNYKFEGKERDAETQNDDFGAREYSWRAGRWLSADWSAIPAPVPYANLSNPQTLNLYAMVADDPETFADLDGHEQNAISADGTPAAAAATTTGQAPACGPGAASGCPAQDQNAIGFKTPGEAAIAALSIANPQSIKDNKEIGGLIYQDKAGLYHYTSGIEATEEHVNPFKSPAPEGTKIVGDYHTHGDYSWENRDGTITRTSNPKKDNLKSDHFSKDDIRKVYLNNRVFDRTDYTSYLGTPSGKFKVYDPRVGKEQILQ
jgi:RHS repeat-associated protein